MNLLSTDYSPSAKSFSVKTLNCASAWPFCQMILTRSTASLRPAVIVASLSAQPHGKPVSSCSTGMSFANTSWPSFGRPRSRFPAANWPAAFANVRGRTLPTGGYWRTLRGAWVVLCGKCERKEASKASGIRAGRRFGLSWPVNYSGSFADTALNNLLILSSGVVWRAGSVSPVLFA
jgi:hypothetical protein